MSSALTASLVSIAQTHVVGSSPLRPSEGSLAISPGLISRSDAHIMSQYDFIYLASLSFPEHSDVFQPCVFHLNLKNESVCACDWNFVVFISLKDNERGSFHLLVYSLDTRIGSAGVLSDLEPETQSSSWSWISETQLIQSTLLPPKSALSGSWSSEPEVDL